MRFRINGYVDEAKRLFYRGQGIDINQIDSENYIERGLSIDERRALEEGELELEII